MNREELNKLTQCIIGCAIEVHRELGPGLLETTYEAAMAIELESGGLRFVRQPVVPVTYKGRVIGEHRLDFIIEDTVVLEIKSVERDNPVFEAQVLTYLRVAGKPLGLLINFNSRLLKEGIKRFAGATLLNESPLKEFRL
jgi:GxxExxY protein